MILLGPRSVDQQQRLLYLIATVEPQEGGPEARYHGAPRLEQRAFSISLEKSFGSNFVRLYISIHASISSSTEPPLLLIGANY